MQRTPSPPPFRQELPDTQQQQQQQQQRQQQQQGRAGTKLSSGVDLGGFSLLTILF